MSNRRGRARYSLVVITLWGVSALGRSLGWSTRMTQPVMEVLSVGRALRQDAGDRHGSRALARRKPRCLQALPPLHDRLCWPYARTIAAHRGLELKNPGAPPGSR